MSIALQPLAAVRSNRCHPANHRPCLASMIMALLWTLSTATAAVTDKDNNHDIAFGVNRDQTHYLQQTQLLLSLHLFNWLRGYQPDPQICDQSLTRLLLAVERDNMSRVSRTRDNTLELEADRNRIFEQPPVLPPEQVREGRWHFEVVRLDLVPRHLFIHALTFKASRTVRLRWVRLIFVDGSSRMHDRWTAMENGNGRAFRKEAYLPWLKVGPQTGPGQAKRLRAIEFLASAQDSHYSAQLDFMFRIPDPNQKPSPERYNLLINIRSNLRDQRFSPQACFQALRALNELPSQ